MVIAELERFGYTLKVVSETEEQAVDSLMAVYERCYRDYNDGDDPREIYEHSEEYSDYDFALGEIYVEEIEFNKVYWD